MSCGSRPTFLESLFHPDHDDMRGFAPFHTCEEHQLVTAVSRKDAMDGHLGPIFPICRRGGTSLLMRLALDALEAGLVGIMLHGGGQGGGEAISGHDHHDE